jgi:hypothetical protein
MIQDEKLEGAIVDAQGIYRERHRWNVSADAQIRVELLGKEE